MNKDKLEQLGKILTVLKEDTVSSKQLVTLLAPIVGAVQKAVSDTKAIAETTKENFATAQKTYQDGLNELKQRIDAVSGNLSAQTQTTLAKAMAALENIEAIEAVDGDDGYTPQKGIDYFDGKDGSPDTGDQIVEKINQLPLEPDCQIDASHIKNLPTIRGGQILGGNRPITVYDEATILTKTLRFLKFTGTGVTATENGNGFVTVTITGGGGSASLAILSTTGAVNDSNKTFPFVAQPILVVVNGYAYREKSGWSWDGSNAILDNAVGTGGDIFAITAGAQIYNTTGTIDNANKSFPFAIQPQLVVVNGSVYRQERGWTWDGSNVTLDNAVGTGGDIYGLVVITPVQLTTGTIDNSNVSFPFASQPTLVVSNGMAYRSGHGWSGNVTVDQAVGTGGDIFAL